MEKLIDTNKEMISEINSMINVAKEIQLELNETKQVQIKNWCIVYNIQNAIDCIENNVLFMRERSLQYVN